MSTFIKAGESIDRKLVKARIRIYSFVSAIIARPASEFLAALSEWSRLQADTDGRTGTRNERCFIRRRYTSRKGTVAPGNPEMEPELTPRRRVSHHTIRPIPLSTVHSSQPAVPV